MIRLRSRLQRGFSLIELSATLAISGALMAGLWQLTGSSGQVQQATVMAKDALAVAGAAQQYIENNRTQLLALTALNSINAATCIKVTSTDSCTTSLNSLKTDGYLPTSFPENTAGAGQTAYGQTYRLYVRREDSGAAGVDSSDKLVGLLLTTGGTEINDKLGIQAVNQLGAAGGFIFDANDTDAAGTSPGVANATAIAGNGGGWTVDLTATGWTTVGSVGQQGHLAVLTALLPQIAKGAASTATGSSTCNNTAIQVRQSTLGHERSLTRVNSTTLSFSQLPAINSTILVFVGGDRGTGPYTPITYGTITDNQGGTYTSVATTTATEQGLVIYSRYLSASPSGTFTITITPSSTNNAFIYGAIEVTGLASASLLDQVAYDSNSSGATSISATSGTLSQENEIAILAGYVDRTTLANSAFSYDNEWRSAFATDTYQSVMTGGSMGVIYKVTSATDAITGTLNHSATDVRSFGILATLRGSSTSRSCTTPSGSGNISVVKSMGIVTGASVDTSSGAFGTMPSAGNTVIVTMQYTLITPQPTSPHKVTDNNGNTYWPVAGNTVEATFGGLGTQIFAAYNITASTSPFTITVNPVGTGVYTRWGAIEVSGLNSDPKTAIAASAETSYAALCCTARTHTLTSPTPTTQDKALAVAVATADNSMSYWGLGSMSAGWTTQLSQDIDGSGGALSMGTRIYSAIATPTGSWNYTPGNDYALSSTMAIFKGADPTASITPATKFDELTDAAASITSYNFFAGSGAGDSISSGTYNTGTGVNATNLNSTGNYNAALGSSALDAITGSSYNVALKSGSLGSMTSGSRNIGIGAMNADTAISDSIGISYAYSGANNGSGSRNIGIGYEAFDDGISGSDNVAIGFLTIGSISGGSVVNASSNIALGNRAMDDAATGDTGVVAIGSNAVGSLTGNYNVCLGDDACLNTTNSTARMTAIGDCAMGNNTGNASTDVAVLGAQCGSVSSTSNHTGTTAVGARITPALTSGQNNTQIGYFSGFSTSTATRNVGIGAGTLYTVSTSAASTGNDNVAIGLSSQSTNNGARNTTAGPNTQDQTSGNRTDNTAAGYRAGRAFNGNGNTGIGGYALSAVTTGTGHTAVGNNALVRIPTSATNSTGVGYSALAGGAGMTTAASGTALGQSAAGGITSGSQVTAIGDYALSVSTTVSNNLAIGYNSMIELVATGGNNTAVGYSALRGLIGANNVAVGSNAMPVTTAAAVAQNTAVGYQALGQLTGGATTSATCVYSATNQKWGSCNTAIGYRALWSLTTTGNSNVGVGGLADLYANGYSNAIAIGANAVVNGSNTVQVGSTAVTWIGAQVGWTNTSDRRLKKDIEPAALGLDFILNLRPVSYRRIGGNGRLDYGFIAQDISDLLQGIPTNLVFQEEGGEKYYRLTYAELLAPLVNAIHSHQGSYLATRRSADALRRQISALTHDLDQLNQSIALRQKVEDLRQQQLALRAALQEQAKVLNQIAGYAGGQP